MHLSLGKTKVFDSTIASKVSTHNSNITPQPPLTPIIEDSSADTKSTFTISESKTSAVVGDSVNSSELIGPQSQYNIHK